MDRNKFIDIFASEVVRITVGKDDKQRKFSIHKDLFTRKAPAFHKMFDGSFKEGVTGLATLPDDNVEAFEVFTNWLYLSIMDKFVCFPQLFPHQDLSTIPWVIVETIVFADKYFMDELSDLAMTTWCIYRYSIPSVAELKKVTGYIVANSSPLCKFRAYLARIWAWEILQRPENDPYNPHGADLDAFIKDRNFAIQVYNEMSCLHRQSRENDTLKGRPLCYYHHHGEGVYCCGIIDHCLPPDKAMKTAAVNPKASVSKPVKKRKLT
ncbi:hypothetical protein VF21_08381 [Pseudogymnoascus sp. 05NY08]|nr:hypothetical protein VF21_08381 [Pseudogymnoascus sp. 05NY08]